MTAIFTRELAASFGGKPSFRVAPFFGEIAAGTGSRSTTLNARSVLSFSACMSRSRSRFRFLRACHEIPHLKSIASTMRDPTMRELLASKTTRSAQRFADRERRLRADDRPDREDDLPDRDFAASGACRCCAAFRGDPACLFFHPANCLLRFPRNSCSPAESFDFAFGRQLPWLCFGLPGTGSYPGQQR